MFTACHIGKRIRAKLETSRDYTRYDILTWLTFRRWRGSIDIGQLISPKIETASIDDFELKCVGMRESPHIQANSVRILRRSSGWLKILHHFLRPSRLVWSHGSANSSFHKPEKSQKIGINWMKTFQTRLITFILLFSITGAHRLVLYTRSAINITARQHTA